MKKHCKKIGEYISPDFKTILCEKHKSREEEDDYGYVRLNEIGSQLDLLLDKSEQMTMYFQTCLAIVDMLLKEGMVLDFGYNDLNYFHKLLEEEMNNLNDWFTGGTF
jgi:hypothetical protein